MDTKRLFEFLRPKTWRQRPEAQPDINDQILSHLSESDPTYRALMDHAYAAFERSAVAGLDPNLDDAKRAYHAGGAAALMGLIATIEDTRYRLKADQAERSRLAQERAERERQLQERRARRFHVEQTPPPGTYPPAA